MDLVARHPTLRVLRLSNFVPNCQNDGTDGVLARTMRVYAYAFLEQ